MDNHGNLYPSPFANPPPPPSAYPHLYPPEAASPEHYDNHPAYPHLYPPEAASPEYYDNRPAYPPQNSTPSAPPPHHRPSDQPPMFPPSHHQLVHTSSILGKTQQSKTTSNNQASLKVLLLHGTLMVSVIEAQNLPNMDMFSHTLVSVIGKRLTSDPYVSITVCSAVLGRTFVVSNSENPKWKQNFEFPVAHRAAEVKFIVKDDDFIGAQLIGTVSVPVERIFSGETVDESFPILDSGGRPCKAGAVLRLSMQYIPIERLRIYHQGVGGGPRYDGVWGTYFPLRTRGRVTLYQDADVPEGFLPEIQLENGMNYEHGRCWRDMFEAISRARKLVYITGWSVLHTVSLIRGGGNGSDCSLGDLLKSKSQEGVRVLLLVWDDPTSRSILGYRTDGLMQTHDEETRRFFKYSTVQVLLCPRSAGKRHSWFKQKETWAIFTHHQKTVIVDAEAGNNMRKIISFVGGLDLCDGRYDNPRHPLFRTLQTLHKDDYHNPNLEGPTTGCPREPWHDLHSRIDGPAAYDILQNFEDRWLKASKHGIERLKRYDDRLLNIERIKDIIGKNDSQHINDNDPENWHVQVFRSIDSNSVKDFPKDPNEGIKKNLACGKNVLIDMSIHTAYVKAIRSAQHFIYIENQYFLGSSYNWDAHEELGANNLIPVEIALKIANKIKAKERFSAYIVIPMWPEGNPTGRVIQQILYWQNKTMQMMYETIYTALKEVGLEDTYEPQDYLNFFCLGNREETEIGATPFRSFSDTAASAPALLARKNRRFMIYVHSKGMIVDDEYVILGSANINQRSLEGTRDTEITIGAYQPQHTWARKLSNPNGQIYGYRMSLWAEHIGALEHCFTSPENLVCVRRVRSLGEMNWRQFVADEVTEMKGHLLKYPVHIDKKGKVMPLPDHETFPDIGGKICGTFFGVEENLTT